jgi:beta-N-acetylhexosaminidase
MQLRALAVFPLLAFGAGGLVLLAGDSDHGSKAATDPTEGLSTRQLAGQRMIYSYAETRPPARLLARLRSGDAAGVILFTRNIGSRAGLRSATRRMQRAARASKLGLPALIMIDQEGGLVKRLPGAPDHSAGEIGAIGRTRLARREGAAAARNLRSVGVNVNLAPVMDVGRPGSFQRRTERAFSGNAKAVGTLGSAWARGSQSVGVAATLKHFPGIGYVSGDEDQRSQRVPLSRAALRANDEVPFGAGIRAGAQLVMTSTAIYPAFGNVPAMLLRELSTDELRGRLGFEGVSITDDIEVPGMRRFGTPASLGLRSARAGNDLLLYAQRFGNAERGRRTLVAAAAKGNPNVGEMRASARRVIALRQALK